MTGTDDKKDGWSFENLKITDSFTTKNVASSTTKIIDDAGDILLVVGLEGKDQINLKVSSKALSLASPVFKALLSPKYKEGSGSIASDGLRHVSLPEDDPCAMELFCNIVHLRNNQISMTSMSMSSMGSIAVLCDKYDGSDALRFWSLAAIPALMGLWGLHGYWLSVLATSYALNHEVSFHAASKAIIYKYDADIIRAARSKNPDRSSEFAIIPDRLLDYLDMQRQHIIHKASSALNELINDIATDSVSCPGQNGYGSLDGSACRRPVVFGLFAKGLVQSGLWPLTKKTRKQSVQEFFDEVAKHSSPLDRFVDTGCGCGPMSSMAGYKMLCNTRMHQEEVRGLCLKCVKEGRISYTEGNCQGEKHQEYEKGKARKGKKGKAIFKGPATWW